MFRQARAALIDPSPSPHQEPPLSGLERLYTKSQVNPCCIEELSGRSTSATPLADAGRWLGFGEDRNLESSSHSKPMLVHQTCGNPVLNQAKRSLDLCLKPSETPHAGSPMNSTLGIGDSSWFYPICIASAQTLGRTRLLC